MYSLIVVRLSHMYLQYVYLVMGVGYNLLNFATPIWFSLFFR